MGYVHRVPPFDHQKMYFELRRDREYYACFWEQGTGKTKFTADVVGWRFLRKDIDGMLLICKNGLQPIWADDQFPDHVSLDVLPHLRTLTYLSGDMKKKSYQRESVDFLTHDGLAVLVMSYDAVSTDAGFKFARKFLTKRAAYLTLDEGAYIKNPSIKRTRAVMRLVDHAPYRMTLTGTPITDSPFNAYAQLRFLDSGFWKRNGVATFTAFKARYAVWETGYNQGREFPQFVRYRNMDDLKALIAEVGDSLLKEDVTDLPPKLGTSIHNTLEPVPQPLRFDLSPKQRRAYDDIETDLMTMLDDGHMVTTPHVLTKLTRLQQMTSGFVGTDDGEVRDVGDKNPRIDLLRGIVEDTTTKTIIWAKFVHDRDLVCAMLDGIKQKHVRFDGSTSTADRKRAVLDFNDGDAQFFVANPAVAGEGLTLVAATAVIYYNNSYKLSERLQSEDRAHRIGQTKPVLYIDLVARDTVDEDILLALRAKSTLGDFLLDRKRKSCTSAT